MCALHQIGMQCLCFNTPSTMWVCEQFLW